MVDVPLLAVRIDSWLCAARIYKSRTIAREACEGGLVKHNGNSVKPSQLVVVGDEVIAQAPRGLVVVDVRSLEAKRQSPQAARELYDDRSPPPPPKEERQIAGVRERGAGRPTKNDRRAIERLQNE